VHCFLCSPVLGTELPRVQWTAASAQSKLTDNACIGFHCSLSFTTFHRQQSLQNRPRRDGFRLIAAGRTKSGHRTLSTPELTTTSGSPLVYPGVYGHQAWDAWRSCYAPGQLIVCLEVPGTTRARCTSCSQRSGQSLPKASSNPPDRAAPVLRPLAVERTAQKPHTCQRPSW